MSKNPSAKALITDMYRLLSLKAKKKIDEDYGADCLTDIFNICGVEPD